LGEVVDSNVVLYGDERRPVAKVCVEKVHAIIVDDYISVRDDFNEFCIEEAQIDWTCTQPSRQQRAPHGTSALAQLLLKLRNRESDQRPGLRRSSNAAARRLLVLTALVALVTALVPLLRVPAIPSTASAAKDPAAAERVQPR
jgi:hypothetical protein